MRSPTERFNLIRAIRTRKSVDYASAVGFIICTMTGGCGRDPFPLAPLSPASTSLISPTPPAPEPERVTLTGRVTESQPNTLTGLWNATVTLKDGKNSWESPLTVGGEGLGRYAISGLRPGRFEAVASADGFVSVSREIVVGADTTTDFPLLPVPETRHFTFKGEVNDTDGTCSDGTQARPCRVCALPIHNPGPIDATLTWNGASGVTLSLTLFRSDQPTPIARSTAVNATTQQLTADLPGLALYELRVTYVSGKGTASYEMPVTYQN